MQFKIYYLSLRANCINSVEETKIKIKNHNSMKEKKHYETPRFSVTQVITEGVFATSNYQPGTLVVEDNKTLVDIESQSGYESGFDGFTWDK